MSSIERVVELAVQVPAPKMRVDMTRVDRMGWEELSIALAGVETMASALIRGMYVGDVGSLRQVQAGLTGLLMQEQSHDTRHISIVARIALTQFALPPLCVVCQGRKTVTIEHVVYDCSACNATGLTPREGREPIERAGLDWPFYQPMFDLAWSVLDAWHSQAAAAIRDKVGKSE